MKERKGLALNGWMMLAVDVVLFLGGGWLVYRFTQEEQVTTLWGAAIVLVLAGVIASGFIVNPPNISRVVTFFGRYIGTVRRNGFVWTLPITNRQRISLRIQNFDSQTLKVNDANGNPI